MDTNSTIPLAVQELNNVFLSEIAKASAKEVTGLRLIYADWLHEQKLLEAELLQRSLGGHADGVKALLPFKQLAKELKRVKQDGPFGMGVTLEPDLPLGCLLLIPSWDTGTWYAFLDDFLLALRKLTRKTIQSLPEVMGVDLIENEDKLKWQLLPTSFGTKSYCIYQYLANGKLLFCVKNRTTPQNPREEKGLEFTSCPSIKKAMLWAEEWEAMDLRTARNRARRASPD